MLRVTLDDADKIEQPEKDEQVLVVDARGFRPEGIDPFNRVELFPRSCPPHGMAKFIVYRVGGPARHRHGDGLRSDHGHHGGCLRKPGRILRGL